jgi:hypothetical protein
MAGRKLPVLPDNAAPADGDLLYNVDVSDTSESPQGTSKQNTFSVLYTYVLNKLATALRLIPSGGTSGQVLSKASGTDYDVEWTTAGGGSGAVTADAPILGDGTSGDHLRLDFDSTPTDGSSKLVNSNGVYDFAAPVINITNAALNTACSGGTINPRAMYRVTDAAQGVVRIWGKSATQASCAAFLEGSADGSTYLEGAWGNYDLSVDLFTPQYPSSLETIVPTVTGSGSVDDFSVMFTKQGNTVTAIGFSRSFNVADTETTTTVALTIPAAYAPAVNFTGGFQVYGGANSAQLSSSAGAVGTVALSSVTGTKNIQIDLGLQAAASGDFETAVSFYASWEVVV